MRDSTSTSTIVELFLNETGNMLRLVRVRLHDRRFWIVQALVVLATAVHWTVELFGLATDFDVGLFIAIMYAVYFVPIIYASLNFGREGAIPTAIWAALLALPPTFIWHHGTERLIDVLQHLTIIALAAVIATRVDREVAARQETEREIAGRRVSEAKYRGLFEAASEAIIVFDRSGTVRDANASACALFACTPGEMDETSLDELVGAVDAAYLLRIGRGEANIDRDIQISREDGEVIHLEPACSMVRANGDPELIQVLFHNVTQQRKRQRGLETYAQQIIRAQEEERRRISRDLHDGPLQSIVLLYRQLDALEANDERDAEHPEAELIRARVATEEIADELRRFSRNLRPSILDDLGLAAALRWLVNDLEQRTELRGDFIVRGDPHTVSQDAELGLFRIAQEGLRNVERHAEASSVAVTLEYAGEEVTLVVQDDGKGFSMEDSVPFSADSGNLGLLGMQERARLLGGTFEVESSLESGTRIRVSLSTGSGMDGASGAPEGSHFPLS